jgi:hypothetical protein
VSLKSCDGVIFLVHAMLLGLASKVFSDMFTIPTTADVVELAEDAEAISIMLAFIYPVVPPRIDTISLFEKAMIVAHKYDIDVLVKILEQTGIQQRGFIRRDPLRIFRLAADYGLRDTQTHAAKLVGLQHRDMLSLDGLVKLAKEFPNSAHIIGLVGAQHLRPEILNSLLTPGGRIWPARDENTGLQYLKCPISTCYASVVTVEGSLRYRPGWFPSWSQSLRSALSEKPLDECDSYFQVSCLRQIKPSGCEQCTDQTFKELTHFKKWAKDTRLLLETELANLDVLYAL